MDFCVEDIRIYRVKLMYFILLDFSFDKIAFMIKISYSFVQ